MWFLKHRAWLNIKDSFLDKACVCVGESTGLGAWTAELDCSSEFCEVMASQMRHFTSKEPSWAFPRRTLLTPTIQPSPPMQYFACYGHSSDGETEAQSSMHPSTQALKWKCQHVNTDGRAHNAILRYWTALTTLTSIALSHGLNRNHAGSFQGLCMYLICMSLQRSQVLSPIMRWPQWSHGGQTCA